LDLPYVADFLKERLRREGIEEEEIEGHVCVAASRLHGFITQKMKTLGPRGQSGDDD